MKLTKSQLREIIKEEISKAVSSLNEGKFTSLNKKQDIRAAESMISRIEESGKELTDEQQEKLNRIKKELASPHPVLFYKAAKRLYADVMGEDHLAGGYWN